MERAPASAAAGGVLLLATGAARGTLRHHALDLQNALHNVQRLLLLGCGTVCDDKHKVESLTRCRDCCGELLYTLGD